ncbi:hypothetical protein ALC62_01523 [Cyphomyrmex costatus]|uniref:Uncharacterized protein n=1 Tax=Cyphomyrmex costatus TaxID=456900 RepID=A0A195D383_9HYME|nr:hypothetical protein ALC62_01523 [Cyphomyrmex costatus]
MIVRETANNFARKRSIAEDDDNDNDNDDDDGSGSGVAASSLLFDPKIDRGSAEEVQDEEGTRNEEAYRE